MNTQDEAWFKLFTDREVALMHEMASAIWGIDFTKARRVWVDHPILEIPYFDGSVRWYAETDPMPWPETPRFERIRVELDRWLVPWRLRAGYADKIKTIFMMLA